MTSLERNVLTVRENFKLSQRFNDNVNPVSGCWQWNVFHYIPIIRSFYALFKKSV